MSLKYINGVSCGGDFERGGWPVGKEKKGNVNKIVGEEMGGKDKFNVGGGEEVVGGEGAFGEQGGARP